MCIGVRDSVSSADFISDIVVTIYGENRNAVKISYMVSFFPLFVTLCCEKYAKYKKSHKAYNEKRRDSVFCSFTHSLPSLFSCFSNSLRFCSSSAVRAR